LDIDDSLTKFQLSIINYQLSIINYQLSIINYHFANPVILSYAYSFYLKIYPQETQPSHVKRENRHIKLNNLICNET